LISSPTLAAATSGDHLHHFVAHVALAAGELVRGLERDVGRQCRRRDGDREQCAQRGQQTGSARRRTAGRV
jgi:hypothetical protein